MSNIVIFSCFDPFMFSFRLVLLSVPVPVYLLSDYMLHTCVSLSLPCLCLGHRVLVLFHRQWPSCCFPRLIKCSTILIWSFNHLFYLASCVPNRFYLVKSLFWILTFVRVVYLVISIASVRWTQIQALTFMSVERSRYRLNQSSSIPFTYWEWDSVNFSLLTYFWTAK